MPELNSEELKRYSRHFVLPHFGTEGQLRLKNSKILVVGAGGLGSPVLLYLTAAGVGSIGIIDNDDLDASNLQRQVLYTSKDVGKSKASNAEKRLSDLNPNTIFTVYDEALLADNALLILKDYDLIIDGTDNFPTRYLINDACTILGKPFIYGSIFRYEGQVSVFNYKGGPTYRDLFPEPPPPGAVPNCAEGGVLGVLPGIIGSMQANEALKILADFGEPLSGKLLLFDALTMDTRIINIRKDPAVKTITKLIDYEEFCGIDKIENKMSVKEVTVQELNAMRESGEDFQLIDVREQYEYDIAHLDGTLIPLAAVVSSADSVSKEKKVVVHCRSGARSATAIMQLQALGYDNLYNLKGGILAWADEIDNTVTKY